MWTTRHRIGSMAKLSIKKALEQVEKAIDEVEALREGSYDNGKDYVDAIDAKIKRIIKLSFDDAEEKLAEYNRRPSIVGGSIKGKPDFEKAYQNDMAWFLRQLHAIKEELKLLQDAEAAETKLDKTEADIEKARKEAERRGYVVDSKVAGAAIEIIDRLRDELKGRTDNLKEISSLKNEISGLKNEISDLRESLELFAEDQRVDINFLKAQREEEIRRLEESGEL